MGEKNSYCALPRGTITTDANEDQLLPIANIGRIMKKVLPPNSKISKNAKETMQECASEFIGFVTGEAADICKKEKHKTINGDDICQALGVLGLDHYAEAMKRYLKRYRECEENMIALKVSTSAQLDCPRTELSLFGGDLHDEDNQTFSNVPTITKFL